MSKLTGKKHTLTVDSVEVKTLSVKPKIAVETVDSTDSDEYDATTELFHRDHHKVATTTELAVEGFFRNVNGSGGTIATLLQKCYAAAGVAVGAITLDGTNTLGTGAWDITDFEADVPRMDMVKFTATFKSKGKITWTDVPAPG